MSSNTFDQTWGCAWIVQATVEGATSYVVEDTPHHFKSGRPKKDVVYYDADKVEICRREGMNLTSQKGNEYTVCKKNPDTTYRGRRCDATATDDKPDPSSVADMFDDLE